MQIGFPSLSERVKLSTGRTLSRSLKMDVQADLVQKPRLLKRQFGNEVTRTGILNAFEITWEHPETTNLCTAGRGEMIHSTLYTIIRPISVH
jgi:hypothetical protein